MTHLFSDPAVVEAGARAIYSQEGAHHVTAGHRHTAGRVLAAAVAALPRDELIERAARLLADHFDYKWVEDHDKSTATEAFYTAGHWKHIAERQLVAIGLIPEHVTATEERCKKP